MEITVVLKGKADLEFEGGDCDIVVGQAVVTEPGEWVRYSTPDVDAAECRAVCAANVVTVYGAPIDAAVRY